MKPLAVHIIPEGLDPKKDIQYTVLPYLLWADRIGVDVQNMVFAPPQPFNAPMNLLLRPLKKFVSGIGILRWHTPCHVVHEGPCIKYP
jgi:hypothetical protein